MKKIWKIFLALFAIIASVMSLSAETKTTDSGYTLRLKASRDGSEYKRGETAEFILEVSKDGKPTEALKLHGEITKDTVPMNNTFSGETKNGKFSVKGKLDEAGFLKCRMVVKVPNKEGQFENVDMLAGAAFDPLEIKPSLPAPDDFDEYWDKQKKILAGIPMNVKLTKVKCGDKNIEMYDVQADTFKGKLSAYLAFKKDAAPKSLPAIVCAHGAGVRSSSKGVLYWANRGFIALDFNAHGLPNGQPKEFYEKLKNGELKGYQHLGKSDRDTIFFRVLYMRLMRAMDVIMARPEWDGKNLVVNGGSQGGGQALAAGGLNPKVTGVIAMYPAICDHSGIVINRTNGWPHFIRADKDGNYNKKILEAARYIDAVNFAERIKGKVVYMINYADNVCEPTSCYAAYNNIKTPKKLFINEESRHAPAKGTTKELQDMMIEILKQDGVNVN